MDSELKLFVWENVLKTYTSGVMFALAFDVAMAREMLLQQCSYLPEEDLAKEPNVYTSPFSFHVWGGA